MAQNLIYDGIIEVSEYLLGPVGPPAPTSNLREVAERTVLGEEEDPPDLPPLRRIQVS